MSTAVLDTTGSVHIHVTFRPTCVADVALESNKNYIFRVCACSLTLFNTHSTCNVLCCHLQPVCPYHIFPHYLMNSTTFRKMLRNTKCAFWFSLQL